jgi:hypothetical protein
MTVLFLILYCAAIWSILGTVLDCAGFVVFKHLRAVKAGWRARDVRVSERVQAEQVQEPNDREGNCLKGNATDIVRPGMFVESGGEVPVESDEQCMFAAGFSLFGIWGTRICRKLSRLAGHHLRHLLPNYALDR